MHKHAIFYIFIFTTTYTVASSSDFYPPYRDTKSSLLRKQRPSKADVFELRAQAERESLNRVNGISSNLQPFLPKELDKITRTNTTSSSYLPSSNASEILSSRKSISDNSAIIAQGTLSDLNPVLVKLAEFGPGTRKEISLDVLPDKFYTGSN